MDLLRVPVLGRLLRWRWGRLALQISLLAVALLVVYDGFTGRQLASRNLATLLTWIHYRGGVILLLLVAGNLFCMGCPFSLLRSLTPKLARQGGRWPRHLRHKWGAILLTLVFLWLYEWLDLWGSPELTAWIVVLYLAAGFGLEIMFAESPFCKYVCPLGAFNTLFAAVSPLRVRSRDRSVCRTCINKECVNGSLTVPGCGTELYVPQMKSAVDCVLCLDCARACPHDNVALQVGRPGSELLVSQSPWRKSWDSVFLVLLLSFAGLSNAFGMVPPIYVLERRIAEWLLADSEGLILFLIFGVGNVLLPSTLGLLAAAISRSLAGGHEKLRFTLARYVPALLPLAFAIWLGHYLFHFATGALAIVPVFQSFALDHGVEFLGRKPAWQLGPVLPTAWILPLQIMIDLGGLWGGLMVLSRKAPTSSRAQLPWLLLLVVLALAAVYLFTLPMEMRGTVQFAH